MIRLYGILDVGMLMNEGVMFFKDAVLENVEYDTISSRLIYN